MMRSEFEKLVDRYVTEEEYKKIEYVYTWHPCISDVNGKTQIAYLYKEFGMRIILDMTATAREYEELIEDLAELRDQIRVKEERINNLRRGNDENC